MLLLLSLIHIFLAEAAIYAYYNWEKVKHYGLQAWSALKQGIAYYVYGILSLYRLLFGWIPGVGKAFDVLRKKTLEVEMCIRDRDGKNLPGR